MWSKKCITTANGRLKRKKEITRWEVNKMGQKTLNKIGTKN
jgi:hypothetical protein